MPLVGISRGVIFSHSQLKGRARFLDVRGSSGNCTYLLPIRRATFSRPETEQFATYFKKLRKAGCEVVVVDGSPPSVFEAHQAVWAPYAEHRPVDRRFTYLNDKVNGIHTGIEIASGEKIILADDDIRYRPAQIRSVLRRLQTFDVVRPQNFISPLPWWALLETGRMLVNRATLRSGDYPGTCAFRRASALRAGEYDGDVLFDNEEMIRHFARHGLRLDYALNLFVRKKPPSFQKWLEQRPRQAYEDFGLRAKTILFASILPVAVFLGLAWSFTALGAFLVGLLAGSIVIAFAGWKRGVASSVFPRLSYWFAPAWVLERAISTYVALWWHLVRGGYPFGDRMLSRGIGRDWVAGAAAASLTMKKEVCPE